MIISILTYTVFLLFHKYISIYKNIAVIEYLNTANVYYLLYLLLLPVLLIKDYLYIQIEKTYKSNRVLSKNAKLVEEIQKRNSTTALAMLAEVQNELDNSLIILEYNKSYLIYFAKVITTAISVILNTIPSILILTIIFILLDIVIKLLIKSVLMHHRTVVLNYKIQQECLVYTNPILSEYQKNQSTYTSTVLKLRVYRSLLKILSRALFSVYTLLTLALITEQTDAKYIATINRRIEKLTNCIIKLA